MRLWAVQAFRTEGEAYLVYMTTNCADGRAYAPPCGRCYFGHVFFVRVCPLQEGSATGDDNYWRTARGKPGSQAPEFPLVRPGRGGDL